MKLVESFLTHIEEKKVVLAIRHAETKTIGEIRVHLEQNNHLPALDRATQVFQEIGMDQTTQKTGVLIYVAVDSHKIAIIGDLGIDKVVNSDFWESCKNELQNYFRTADFGAGLEVVINRIGEVLAQHFPIIPSDSNELTDSISKGE